MSLRRSARRGHGSRNNNGGLNNTPAKSLVTGRKRKLLEVEIVRVQKFGENSRVPNNFKATSSVSPNVTCSVETVQPFPPEFCVELEAKFPKNSNVAKRVELEFEGFDYVEIDSVKNERFSVREENQDDCELGFHNHNLTQGMKTTTDQKATEEQELLYFDAILNRLHQNKASGQYRVEETSAKRVMYKRQFTNDQHAEPVSDRKPKNQPTKNGDSRKLEREAFNKEHKLDGAGRCGLSNVNHFLPEQVTIAQQQQGVKPTQQLPANQVENNIAADIENIKLDLGLVFAVLNPELTRLMELYDVSGTDNFDGLDV